MHAKKSHTQGLLAQRQYRQRAALNTPPFGLPRTESHTAGHCVDRRMSLKARMGEPTFQLATAFFHFVTPHDLSSGIVR